MKTWKLGIWPPDLDLWGNSLYKRISKGCCDACGCTASGIFLKYSPRELSTLIFPQLLRQLLISGIYSIWSAWKNKGKRARWKMKFSTRLSFGKPTPCIMFGIVKSFENTEARVFYIISLARGGGLDPARFSILQRNLPCGFALEIKDGDLWLGVNPSVSTKTSYSLDRFRL